MGSTARTIDVGPSDNRPLTALILAILAVPGSTLAWELPLGGLWIGLPFAVAAIVIGNRARRRPGGSTVATVAIVIAALMIAQMAAWFVASAVS